ncbi:MAG: radical SAM protein [Desulfobacteraceae bacterium]|nr:radical SAM protein [Desulfobacteraceae bacterium]
MASVLLIQLPIAQLNFAKSTANIPLAAACLKQAALNLSGVDIRILDQHLASNLGDGALLDLILSQKPDIIAFTTFMWNVKRVLHLAQMIKQSYNPRIVLGGPEITPDNIMVKNPNIDFLVSGPGEEIFTRLLTDDAFWLKKHAASTGFKAFESSDSPYLDIRLDCKSDNIMFLETTRGCPWRCAYCYYSKSIQGLTFKRPEHIYSAFDWALANGVKEIFLLDPALNSRPDLKTVLKKIARLNSQRSISIISEMRAEAIDAEMADLLENAGFTWLETGLQSTNPTALKLMGRTNDLTRFTTGVSLVRERNITTCVDLIAGLPGDDLEGFKQSVDFINTSQCADDTQVFTLSILPGTQFRRESRHLGISYAPEPPYHVIQTPAFSANDFRHAFDYAQSKLATVYFPPPDLELAWKTKQSGPIETADDIAVKAGSKQYVYKVMLHTQRSLDHLEDVARQVTHPYQIWFLAQGFTPHKVVQAIELFTSINPYTPFELVLFEPEGLNDPGLFIQSARLNRPHYLDGELRHLYPQAGNRAILTTIVTRKQTVEFSGPMLRTIFWWEKSNLPDRKALDHLESCDFGGILIDSPANLNYQQTWQERMSHQADDLILISFSSFGLQKRWMQITSSENYSFTVFP